MSLPLRKRIQVRPLLIGLLCGWLLLLHLMVLLGHGLDGPATPVGDALLARSPEMASANIVTTVVVSYRGFDTLGEVTVLFLAATAIGLYSSSRYASSRRRLASRSAPHRPPSEMMTTGIRLLFPVLLLLGVYIVVHGHLSPGGGFQGGVIVATAFFLRMLADPSFALAHRSVRRLESLSGSAIVLLGLLGLAIASTATFLGNFLPHPIEAMGELVSGGLIPLLYCLIGIKVGAEVGAIFQAMLEHDSNGESATGP